MCMCEIEREIKELLVYYCTTSVGGKRLMHVGCFAVIDEVTIIVWCRLTNHRAAHSHNQLSWLFAIVLE